jgi:hypothetical protein
MALEIWPLVTTVILMILYANVKSTWGTNSLVSAIRTITKVLKRAIALKVKGKVVLVLN